MLKPTRRELLGGLIAAACSDRAAAAAQPKLRAIRDHLRQRARQVKLPSVSFALALGEKILGVQALGDADLENRVPASSRSLYRLCSISKALTAVATLQLVDHKRLDLDAAIETYLEDLPKAWRSITTRQLLGHSSGIRHYRNQAEVYQSRHYERLQDAFDLFRDDPLLFEPGSKVQYSTSVLKY
jgi:CubicO group peptidase (beta-lactamase class C family)